MRRGFLIFTTLVLLAGMYAVCVYTKSGSIQTLQIKFIGTPLNPGKLTGVWTLSVPNSDCIYFFDDALQKVDKISVKNTATTPEWTPSYIKVKGGAAWYNCSWTGSNINGNTAQEIPCNKMPANSGR